MENRHPQRVEDYTTANLILIFVNLLWMFGILWSWLGIGAVLVAGAVINHMIARLEAVRARREAAMDRFGKPDAQGCNLSPDDPDPV
ncbi:histidinol phosphate aminotransferase [Thetidibacter halocola]|uniref:Histidinol phosphate aminotransferase n=1 Tax=Thetidibacter halocola TaxID=2827239 RepID=A0A8J7WE54_9RHOB|nr:histidinol phosphate aminotransferase [Thetidibacter halocola]MBS0125112.1 histidinol phosphate aminotransferase [Thetidibacter halocola]